MYNVRRHPKFSMFSTKYLRFLRHFIFTPTRSYRHTASVSQIILFLHVNGHPFKDFYTEYKYLVKEMKKALYQDINCAIIPLFSSRAWCLCNLNLEISPLWESNTFKHILWLETQYSTWVLSDFEVFLMSDLWFQERDGHSSRDIRVWKLPIN